MKILVTGAAGYLGSHVSLELLENGFEVIGLDNLQSGSLHAIERVQELAGRPMALHEVDLCDETATASLFGHHEIDAVIHLAGVKAVGESVENPLRYYRTNVAGTISLLRAMSTCHVTRLVFSSSCTVYGDPPPDQMPLIESAMTRASNPYGRSKLHIEEMLRDLCVANHDLSVISLRYFNPIGAHVSGRIGEDPVGTPNNLLPFVTQVAAGQRDAVRVFGGDYPTPDGTCVRDFIHVVDLAKGHVAALEALDDPELSFDAINLGTGRGSSVLEVLDATEAAVGSPIPYEIVGRRPGDAAAVYADPAYAQKRLGWRAERELKEMCADHWNWQCNNPNGYG
jgi:UDP-glucose 4-epimerase